MNTVYQIPLPNHDPLLKMSVVEEHLAQVFHPLPDRETIVGWIDDGQLEGKQIGRGNNWYIYRSSLVEFINSVCAPRQQKLAA